MYMTHIGENGKNSDRIFRLLKRLTDIVVSTAGLLLLSPLLTAIAAAIRFDSAGPALFLQHRVGQNGKVFRMYKFRTMVVDAEKQLDALTSRNAMKNIVFKCKNDPRVTRVGAFLRKTSIDELPQLINVLKGEMSLVGPRPSLVKEFNSYSGWHTLRLTIKPGITGLWQVSGRNMLDFDEMVRLDFRYIRERSMLKDIFIMLRTLPLFFGDANAF